MSFTRFAEVGRVVLVTYGPDEGKLGVIVDIVDQNRALIDGPRSVTGIHRQTVNFRQLALTPLSIKIGRNAREKSIKKALEKADTLSKWEATAWAQKRAARKARSSESDFQRFENMLKRTKRARAIRTTVRKLKKAA